ncbi:MAG: TIGR04282 family arsenosugar biosynthesis glycosyltransferase [Planctomycetota bacterium]
MTSSPAAPPCFLVMAKPPVPGRVKTRLTPALSPEQAAAVHAAMFTALLTRLHRFVESGQAALTVALALPDVPTAAEKRTAALHEAFAGYPDALNALLGLDLAVVSQGQGDLGQRIANAWPQDAPAVVLGVDSPDLPEAHLRGALEAPATHGAAIGPTGDGGYWTLAACRPPQPLLGLPPHARIDWGTPAVYDQSHRNAREADLPLADLPPWHDVDTPDDLQRLRDRLTETTDPALQHLADQLRAILN